ncbi:MAG: hypothetical protein GY940_06325 [bacterium]|nr:hypothetical protein [bacterium]
MSKRKVQTAPNVNRDACAGKEFQTLLNRYHDNELDAVTRERVSAHLNRCGVCREELILLEEVTAGVKQLSTVETGPGFTAMLMEKVNRQQEKNRWSLRLGFPSVVYSLVFIVFLGLGIAVNNFLVLPTAVPPEGLQTQPVEEVYMAQLFDESRQLSLIDVQDTTMNLFNGQDNGQDNGNGEYDE